MSAPLNYPPEIIDAMVTMQRAAQLLDQEMADLQRVVHGLVSESKSVAVQTFSEVQGMWNQSGLAHNKTLGEVAQAAGESYNEIAEFDAHLASQLQA